MMDKKDIFDRVCELLVPAVIFVGTIYLVYGAGGWS
jgi:hypothetical protein